MNAFKSTSFVCKNLTNIVKHTFQKNVRAFGSGSGFVNVQINSKTGIATVSLQRPPVNGLNLELVTELTNATMQIEKDKGRGIIVTSVCFFCFYYFSSNLEIPNHNLVFFWQSDIISDKTIHDKTYISKFEKIN